MADPIGSARPDKAELCSLRPPSTLISPLLFRNHVHREHSDDFACSAGRDTKSREEMVNGLIYLVGLIVVIMFILSFLGLR
jgi:hypothetical protein